MSDRVAPHKRDLLSLYWAHYWAYTRYQLDGPITEKETHERLSQLDSLWGKMSLGAKKMVDPLWEESGGTIPGWTELKALRCPNCGWVHYVDATSSGPPRCHICMRDVVVYPKGEETKQRLEELNGERQKILDEVFRTRNGELAITMLKQINKERDNLLAVQARLKGAGVQCD